MTVDLFRISFDGAVTSAVRWDGIPRQARGPSILALPLSGAAPRVSIPHMTWCASFCESFLAPPSASPPSQVLLLSEGFQTARDLARKLVSLFSLSKELLSPQQHYDWGLRALKTSLGIAGKELREVRGGGEGGKGG